MCPSLVLEILFLCQKWSQLSRSRQEGSYPWYMLPHKRTAPAPGQIGLLRLRSVTIHSHQNLGTRSRDPWEAAQVWPDKPSWIYTAAEAVPVLGTWYRELQPCSEGVRPHARLWWQVSSQQREDRESALMLPVGVNREAGLRLQKPLLLAVVSRASESRQLECWSWGVL